MRRIALALFLTAFCATSTAQTFDFGNVLQRGVNEVLRSINTPPAPAPSSPRPTYIPSSPPPSPVFSPAPSSSKSTSSPAARPAATPPSGIARTGSAPEQNVDARIADMLGNPAEFRVFFDQLKQAVAASDPHALSRMMRYPLRVSGNIKIFNEKDFIDNYDRIFTPAVLTAVKNQSYGDLFVRDQGASVSNGILWFTGVCTDNSCNRRIPKVVTVNTPSTDADTTNQTPSPSPAPTQPAGAHVLAGLSLPTDTLPGEFGVCRNIPLQSTPGSLTIAGALERGGVDCYRFNGRNGQTVHIELVSIAVGFHIDGLADNRYELEFKPQNQVYDIVLAHTFPNSPRDHYELHLSFK